MVAGSSFVGGEQVAPSPGSESSPSNTKQLDGALRHFHIPTNTFEKASSSGADCVDFRQSFLRHSLPWCERHRNHIFLFVSSRWGWVLSPEFSRY